MYKIKIGETELHVCNFYPFRYQTGKLCLRFEVSKEEIDFETLYGLLHNNTEPIAFYEKEEDEKPVAIYSKYSEFTCQYNNGIYSVEQVAESVSDTILGNLQAQAEQMMAVIQEQSQVINNQAAMLDILADCTLDMSTEIYKGSKDILTKDGVKGMIQESQCKMLEGMLKGFEREESKNNESNY